MPGFDLSNIDPKMLMAIYMADQAGQKLAPDSAFGGLASNTIQAHQFSQLLNRALGPDDSKVTISNKGINSQTPITEEMRASLLESMPSAKAAAATQLGVRTPDQLRKAMGLETPSPEQAGTGITDPFLLSL